MSKLMKELYESLRQYLHGLEGPGLDFGCPPPIREMISSLRYISALQAQRLKVYFPAYSSPAHSIAEVAAWLLWVRLVKHTRNYNFVG